jgi:hypothetical protein
LSVDINEDAATVKTFLEEQGLTFAVFLDSGPASQTYQVRGIPSSFYITREGVIYDHHVGALDVAYIEGLLKDIP